jgi:hypothetical protein
VETFASFMEQADKYFTAGITSPEMAEECMWPKNKVKNNKITSLL